MKTLKAGWTMHMTTVYDNTYEPATYDVSQSHDFVKYLVSEFAKYNLNGAFNLPKGYEGGIVIFQDSKQQFLYELHGGFNLYKRLREAYLQWQEQELMHAMAEQIQKEIDKEILEQLMKEAELEELTNSLKRIDL